MAKIELKFLDTCTEGSFLQIENNYIDHHEDDISIRIMGTDSIGSTSEGEEIPVNFDLWLDLPTAIKFSKTLQAKIREVKNSDFETKSNLF